MVTDMEPGIPLAKGIINYRPAKINSEISSGC